jgi:hypothetical protein
MDSADNADGEIPRGKSDLEERREKLDREASEREKLHRDLMKHYGQVLEQMREANRKRKRKLKQLASLLTIAGVFIGIALILGASHTGGFWSRLMDRVGTGFLVTATVGVAAYVVGAYWKAATETSNEAILEELVSLSDLVIEVSTSTDAAKSVLERLDEFLGWQEAKRVVANRERGKRARELLARMKELRGKSSGLPAPESREEEQGNH